MYADELGAKKAEKRSAHEINVRNGILPVCEVSFRAAGGGCDPYRF